ncbi:hypothetical protein B0H16DRAFT_54303 [Mycena metata]|uniref:Uncharacterized protein n=1 Tax=Mycena metata TaxID=1033252 RepID=A0AAD7IDC4_9AGAR|nr:hypothetical protein B0H16DRAFT_54303 [Mycena metata]
MSSKIVASARTHPCLRGILPASETQRGLIAKPCHFTINNKNHISDYPYDINPFQGKWHSPKSNYEQYHVSYCKISGRGPPPADLTNATPGDIYIDLSPEAYAVYGKVAASESGSAWKRWFDPQPKLRDDAVMVKHPYFHNRVLWCSPTSGINWFAADAVRPIQDRAVEARLVSTIAGKTEATKWKEAAAVIGMSLNPSRGKGSRPRVQARRSISPLSPALDSREPSPLTGKRKTRHQGAPDESESRSTLTFLEGERYKAVLRGLAQRFRTERNEIAEDVRALEEYLASNPPPPLDVPQSKEFSELIEKVLARGIESYTHELDPGVREYCDLQAELAAVEAQRSNEECILEDMQISLGLAIFEHKRLKNQ